MREKVIGRSGNTIIFEYSHTMRTRYRIGGVVAMRLVAWVAVAGVCGFLVQPVFGFQETTVGGGDPPAQGRPAPSEPKAAPATGGNPLNLSLPEIGAGKSTGTEVRIPGLGTVGVLPKLDFGLELLYGAAEQKGVAPEDRTQPDTDLQIRGTIKHRF
jgi:hypothetical protein